MQANCQKLFKKILLKEASRSTNHQILLHKKKDDFVQTLASFGIKNTQTGLTYFQKAKEIEAKFGEPKLRIIQQNFLGGNDLVFKVFFEAPDLINNQILSEQQRDDLYDLTAKLISKAVLSAREIEIKGHNWPKEEKKRAFNTAKEITQKNCEDGKLLLRNPDMMNLIRDFHTATRDADFNCDTARKIVRAKNYLRTAKSEDVTKLFNLIFSYDKVLENDYTTLLLLFPGSSS